MMDHAGVTAGLVLLDCCRNVPDFLSEKGAKRSMGGSTRALPAGMSAAAPARLQDMLVAYATAPGEVALDRSPSAPLHSPFTAALLRALEAPRRRVELAPFLTTTVLQDSKNQQRPHVGGSLGVEAADMVLG